MESRSGRGTVDVERVMPQNVAAEEALLGALLIDADAVTTIAPLVAAEDFYNQHHGVIYSALIALNNRHERGDFVTVCDELERQDKLRDVGGAGFLASLVNAAPTAIHAEHYAKIVQRCALMRRLIRAAGKIAVIGYEEPPDVDEALDRAEQILFDVSQRRVSQDFVPLQVALRDYFDRIDYLHQHKGEIAGVPTGFHDLDNLTNGLQASDLIIIAGRPAVGKTAFCLSIARNAAVMHRTPVAIFSLEMSVEQLVQRLLCAEANVDAQRLRSGFVDEYEWRRISEAFGTLSETPIFIDDTATLTSMEVRAKARRLKAEHKIGLVLIDYLQLMQGRGLENRVQEVAEISRGLKGLARELDLPVIALSQLSRAVESRQDHRPVLSDLRESGSIEQDADIVLFIHREELYNPNTERKNIADIILAKHRNGPVGQVSLRFFPGQTRFGDLELYRQGDEGY